MRNRGWVWGERCGAGLCEAGEGRGGWKAWNLFEGFEVGLRDV